MKARWKLLIGMGIFFMLLAASLMVTTHFQPENEVEAYKKILRDRGEKLEIGEVLPPPVAPESNSVNAVEAAFRMLGSGSEKIPDAMKMVAPGKALIGWMQPEACGYDFTNSWDDFAAEMAPVHPAIELLHQVLARPKLDFQLDYTKGATLPLPHLMALKRAAQILDAAVICDLHNGDAGAATTNILTLLGLVQRNESEGVLISHLVRIAMTAIAVAPTWELLQSTNVTDTQLAAVQTSWEQMNYFKDAEISFTMERVWMMETIEKSRASQEGFEQTFGLAASMSSGGGSSTGSSWTWPLDWETITERPRYAVAEVMWRSAWSYSDELRTLQMEQIILETLRTMQTNQSQFYMANYNAMTVRASSLGFTNAGMDFFQALKIPDFREMFGDWGLSRAVQKTIRIETMRRVVISAVALKRYQLKHGKFPETLGELAPEFVLSVPIDPYDGKQLRYHPNAAGTYLLYSVGDDGKDDGGDPTIPTGGSSSLYWQNDRARDWVWPQPATPEEVRFFYEHPPK